MSKYHQEDYHMSVVTDGDGRSLVTWLKDESPRLERKRDREIERSAELPRGLRAAATHLSSFLRLAAREEGVMRKILPPLPVGPFKREAVQ